MISLEFYYLTIFSMRREGGGREIDIGANFCCAYISLYSRRSTRAILFWCKNNFDDNKIHTLKEILQQLLSFNGFQVYVILSLKLYYGQQSQTERVEKRKHFHSLFIIEESSTYRPTTVDVAMTRGNFHY
jgi:hypothetical protein